MSRFASFAIAIALVATLGNSVSSTAFAQGVADSASALNDAGKELMVAEKYDGAAAKFQEAAAMVPEAKYFINLCTARLQLGELNEALTACNNAENGKPSPEQKTKIGKLIALINEEGKKQNVTPVAVGGGCSGADCQGQVGGTNPPTNTNPNPNPNPNAGYPPPGYTPRPLGQSLVAAGPPDHRYTWTLGVDLFAGAGQIGQPDFYGTAFAGFRIKGDYLFDPVHRLGGELYLQYSNLSAAQDEMAIDALNIVDIGIAGYKHWCPGGTPRLCFTPLVGAHLALMGPESEVDELDGTQVFDYAGVGGRFDLSLEVAFGRRYEHVLGVMVGANVYSEILSGPSERAIAAAGLDTAGGAGYLGLGYTYRFNTPLGSAPFVILE
jgi:hypothetical protein